MDHKEVFCAIHEFSTLFEKHGIMTPNSVTLLKTVGTMKDKTDTTKEIMLFRAEMWSDFCSFLIDEIEENLNELLENFSDVSEKHKKFAQYKTEYEILDKKEVIEKQKSEYIAKIKSNYSNLLSLKEELDNEKVILLFQGKKEYLTKVFSVLVTIISISYSALVGLNFPSFQNLISPVVPKDLAIIAAVIIWILLVIITYFGGKRIFKIKRNEKN
jgi:hypothetical protein